MDLTTSITLADVVDGSSGLQWLGKQDTFPPAPSLDDIFYNTADGNTYICVQVKLDGSGVWEIFSQSGVSRIYDINFNKNKINKYYEKNSEGEYTFTYSPSEISFYPIEIAEETIRLDIENYNLGIQFSSLNQEIENSPIYYLKEKNTFAALNSFITIDVFNTWYLNFKLIEQTVIGRHSLEIAYTNQIDSENLLSWETLIETDNVYIRLKLADKITWFNYGIKGQNPEPTADILNYFNGFLYNYELNRNEDFLLLFLLYTKEGLEEKLKGNFPVNIQWGTNETAAKLITNAANIVASIDNTKIAFSENGIDVTNGGLTIYDQNNNKLLYSDNEGNLFVTGDISGSSGTFTGKIIVGEGSYFGGTLTAASGDFKGTLTGATGDFTGRITAQSGILQDIYIGDINNEHIRLFTEYDEIGKITGGGIIHKKNNTSNFSIDLDGHLTARSISLDHGTIGNISFSNSTISSNTWSIEPDLASFSNILASGKITTAIFEQNQVQMCGGTFLFKDGFSIAELEFLSDESETQSFSPTVLTGSLPEEVLVENYFNSKNLYLVTNQSRSLRFFATFEDNKLKSVGAIPKGKYNLILDLGAMNTQNVPVDWIIGINSTASNITEAGLASNSITLSAIEQIENNYAIIPKIILGKLPSDLDGVGGSYGLYAESAYLTGTLTTKYTDHSIGYAGINTLSGVGFSKNLGDLTTDTSNIVIWAGSKGVTDDAIQDANFQVTANGTLYATQGYFKGSILTDARITASEIQTAKIYGNGAAPALEILDAKKGISFKSTYLDQNDNVEKIKEVFSLTDSALTLNENFYFEKAKGYSLLSLNDDFTQGINIKPNRINFLTMPSVDINSADFNSEEKIEEISNTNYGTYYLNYSSFSGLQFKTYKNYNNLETHTSILDLEETSVNIYPAVSLQNSIYWGDVQKAAYVLEGKKVYNDNKWIGIDIYIEEIE